MLIESLLWIDGELWVVGPDDLADFLTSNGWEVDYEDGYFRADKEFLLMEVEFKDGEEAFVSVHDYTPPCLPEGYLVSCGPFVSASY